MRQPVLFYLVSAAMKQPLKYFALLVALLCPSMTQAKSKKSRRTKTAIKNPVQAAKKIKVTPAMLRGKIIFGQGNAAWAINPDGSGKLQVLPKRKGDFGYGHVAFSPDLTHIVYTAPIGWGSRNDGGGTTTHLLSITIDGRHQKVLNPEAPHNYSYAPQFSRDGKQILYAQTFNAQGAADAGNYEVRLVNADGSNDRRVIDAINDVSGEGLPAWSRDGKRIMFKPRPVQSDDNHTTPNTSQLLQTCNLDGTDVQPFDGNYGAFDRRDVSPDGKFRVITDRDDRGVDLQTSDGKFLEHLISDDDLMEGGPSWSGNGKQIVLNVITDILPENKATGAQRKHNPPGIFVVDVSSLKLHQVVADQHWLPIFQWLP